ncbi:MAG: zf-HC2 domain-containing protein [Christensenellales bacterium]
MTKLDCTLVRDLLPLYVDRLLSPETQARVQEHLDACPECRALADHLAAPLPTPPDPQEEQGRKAFLRLRRGQTAARLFAVICLTMVAVGLTLLPAGALGLVPWMILAPFGLSLLFGDVWGILATTAGGTLLIAGLTTDVMLGVLLMPLQLILAGSGILLARAVRALAGRPVRRSASAKAGLCLGAAALLLLSTWGYYELKGNPVTYFEARRAAQSYVQAHYGDRLRLGRTSYNFKMNSFSIEVTEADDSRNSAYVEYVGGEVYDDYQFRVALNMGDELSHMCATLLRAQLSLTDEDLWIDAEVSVPPYTYGMGDAYDPALPARLSIRLDEVFPSQQAHAQRAYQVARCVWGSGIPFERVTISSFLADGNTEYVTTLTAAPEEPGEADAATAVVRAEK